MPIDESFVLIEGEWSCERAHRLLLGLVPGWVVVHRLHPRAGDLYYAFRYSSMSEALAAGSTESVTTKLDLHEATAAPTRASDTGFVQKPTVVISRGLVAGVVAPADKPRSKKRWFAGTRESVDGGSALELSRAVRASAPPQVELGKTVSLVVELIRDIAAVGTVPVAAALAEAIDIVVQPSGGIELQGPSDGRIEVADSGIPSLLFTVAGRAIGPGEATVLVFQQGQGVGRISVSIRVVERSTDATPEVASARIEAPTARPPDLQLLVLERGAGRGATYELRLSAADPKLGLNLMLFGPFGLEQDPRDFFKAFYTDIEGILTAVATPRQKLQRLASKGDYLFEKLMPVDAQALLWKLRSRIRSVHIQSMEPWIPWELIRLSGSDGNGGIEEGGFLCEEFEVTRWVPGLAYQSALTLKEIGVVTPGDSGLPAAVPERNAMFALRTPDRRVTPIDAEEVALRKALGSGTFDAIHFTGHGTATGTSADRAEIQLAQGSRLRPEDLTGPVFGMRRKPPLVFLNACEIGRAGMGLTGPGGWPRGFLNAGAGAFIGPFWKVLDGTAASFAGAFYQALLGGATVGKAALDARKLIKAASDPTWLAYSVYAHYDARLAS